MAHDPGELGFVVHRLQQSGEDEHRPAREGEGVHLGIVQQGEGELEAAVAAIGGGLEPAADALYVILQKRVLHRPIPLTDLLRGFLAELNILFPGEQIEPGFGPDVRSRLGGQEGRQKE